MNENPQFQRGTLKIDILLEFQLRIVTLKLLIEMHKIPESLRLMLIIL